jgi:hypothetical protein
MTTLLNFIRAHRLKPSEVMNRLQDAGIAFDAGEGVEGED